MNKKPYIAVSRCLLGENVRYDGASKPLPHLVSKLEEEFNIVKVCPEVEIGLSVPRPPVQLIERDAMIRAVGVDDPNLDITDQVNNFAEDFLKANPLVSGLVLKARSPSCGVGTTPIFSEQFLGDGLFAARIAELKPDMPLVNETHIATDVEILEFVEKVKTYAINVNS